MVKSILEDTFEKLVEQGTTQAKKAAKSATQQVKQTASSTKMWEQILGTNSDNARTEAVEERRDLPAGRQETSEAKGDKSNHTPLNLEKLGKKYQDSEKQKAEVLKQRLFQLVKRGEEKVLEEKKKEEAEKKRKSTFEAEEKKKKEAEKKKQEQMTEIPKGKVRRSIFSPKKIAQRQHAEVKPSTGKQ